MPSSRCVCCLVAGVALLTASDAFHVPVSAGRARRRPLSSPVESLDQTCSTGASSTTRLWSEQYLGAGMLDAKAAALLGSKMAEAALTVQDRRGEAAGAARSTQQRLDSVLTQIASADSRTSVYERATSQAEAERQVLRATKRWLDTVTSGRENAPAETTALYAKDGVLWGTVSEELRVNRNEIQDYFEVFARLPKLRVRSYTPYVRVFGDTAINDGYYVFAWEGQDGGFVEKHARFSFVFRRTPTGDWEIVDHHSSLVPKAPAGLRKATTVLPR